MEGEILFALTVFSGFMMAWAVGANDVANAMGTSVGSKSITIRQAIVIAAIFEALGATLASGQVTTTLRDGIVDMELLSDVPMVIVFGMLSSLFASATWLILATFWGWPVSTTHTIVGALIGFGVLTVGVWHVHWAVIFNIAMSWVVTPCLAGILAFVLFRSINMLILSHKAPLMRAKQVLPFYVFFSTFLTMNLALLQGLKPLAIKISQQEIYAFSFVVALLSSWVSYWRMHCLQGDVSADDPFRFHLVERAFGLLAVFTACAMAFAHGSNDVANAIGPMAAVVDILLDDQVNFVGQPIPLWVVGIGAFGIVMGLVMYGYRIIETVGVKITSLTPSRSFASQLATATVVIVSSSVGLPVSTTQTLVGAVLGVGMARGIGALNLEVVRGIFLSWLITLPVGAVLSMVYFVLLHGLYNGTLFNW